ncbi:MULTISPECIES: restriction endonuclease subunit S [Aminobacterium]|jgi:type I restriction enzyme S subunit|uniref:Restriction modification system DNA specificity domain protein n=1 Tax=Aminobacterium colombiense (strain DSM 12261 / ALA-1) TaxID=572547 RepID=D5EDF9_AMICL|nr:MULTISPECIES: restriction endonuclease subunit S [Aminobacterium]ADE56591.1 restriction modification system DNA specificity domain protein [Aminobacterium colombiense DSM 12261]MDD2379936.1 restriction endonuclease subunit S [Aminobacterium colombiense]MDD3768615.1 restriction endonuclease subunit S [Aminobacterium colombiense]
MSSNEWREVKLGEIVDIEMGQSPKSEFYNTEGLGVPFLQGNKTFGMIYPKFDVFCTNVKKIAIQNDILMSVRAPVGDLNIAQEKICIGRGICAMRMKNRNNLYLFYLLKHNVKNLKKTESGTVFGGVNKKDIMGLSVMWTPNLQEQKTIAATLSCLDDKIELNNRINKTLEEMAQAIFKSWFVDFEPFQNGEFIDSELGKIPKGWRVGTLDEIIELFDSKRIPLSSRKREKMQKVYPYYGATSLMDYVDDYIFDGVYVLLGEDGTVIDGKGYPILQYVWGKFWVNNHAHVLKGKNGFSEESLYILLKNTNVKSIVTGAVQLKINQSNLKSVKVIIPSVDKIAEFNYLIARFFAEKRRLSEENQILISVRDALLPKLMSGEVRVPIEEVL